MKATYLVVHCLFRTTIIYNMELCTSRIILGIYIYIYIYIKVGRRGLSRDTYLSNNASRYRSSKQMSSVEVIPEITFGNHEASHLEKKSTFYF